MRGTRWRGLGESRVGRTESIKCLEGSLGSEGVLGEAVIREAVHASSFSSATTTWSGGKKVERARK